jgi:hypothetical protein
MQGSRTPCLPFKDLSKGTTLFLRCTTASSVRREWYSTIDSVGNIELPVQSLKTSISCQCCI